MRTDDADTGMVLAPQALSILPINIWYFLVGRDAGLLPYFFPGLIVLVWFIAGLRRAPLWQWTTFLTSGGAILAMLVLAPYTWNGAGGPPGNRYFLNFYPALLFLLPAGLSPVPGVLAWLGGVAFAGPMVLSPFSASLPGQTWRYVARAPVRWLPIELTIIDDLPIRLDPMRSRIVFVKDPTVFLYYLDPNTYFAEGNGFWTAGAAGADIVIRTEQKLVRLDVTLTARVDNRITVTIGGTTQQVALKAGGETRILLNPKAHFELRGGFAYVLRVTTSAGWVPSEHEAGSTDTRNLGVFVKPVFMYGEPPRALGQVPPVGGDDD